MNLPKKIDCQEYFQIYRAGRVEKTNEDWIIISISLLALFIEQRASAVSEMACCLFMLVGALVWMDAGETEGLAAHTHRRGAYATWTVTGGKRKAPATFKLLSVYVNMGKMPGSHVARKPAATGCRIRKQN